MLLLLQRKRLRKCNNWPGAKIRAGTPSLRGLALPGGLVSTSGAQDGASHRGWGGHGTVSRTETALWGSLVSPVGAGAPSAPEPAAPTLPSPGTQGRDEGRPCRTAGTSETVVSSLHHLVKTSHNLPRKNHLDSGAGGGLHSGLPGAVSCTPRCSRPPPSVLREARAVAPGKQTPPALHRAPRPSPAAEGQEGLSSRPRREGRACEPHQAQTQAGKIGRAHV